MALQITLAGEVTIRGGDGDRLSLRRARARVAFAMLTLERSRGVPRDTLAEAVWPGGVPKTWNSALRNVVSDVRAFVTQVLPEGVDPVLASTGRYQLLLPDDVLVDVELAEGAVAAAQEALAAGDHRRAYELAWQGADVLRAPFLADHDADWALRQQNRLAQVLLVGLETASQAAVALGDGSAALAAADEAIAREPLRESAHRRRMAAHVVAGNRSEALKTYQHLRRLLAEAYGADPSPETEEAYIALLGPAPLAGDAALVGGSGGTSGGGAGAAAGGGRAGGAPLPFVGRRAELAVLVRAWERTVSSRACHVVLVTGDTGIGKTRLVTTAAQHVSAREGLVLLGRCDRDPTLPYQPFVEMLDGFVAEIPEDELPRLDPVARAELAAVFPSFEAPAGPPGPPGSGGPTGPTTQPGTGAPPGAAAPGGADGLGGISGAEGPAGQSGMVEAGASAALPGTGGAGDRGRLFEAVADLLVAATVDRAVAMVLDDLQWADADTLLLLRHLLRRARDVPLLVVAVARDPTDLARPLTDVTHTAERDGRLDRVVLDGLAEPEVRALVEHLRPEAGDEVDRLARRLLSDTAGNPFILVELLRDGRSGDGHGGATGSLAGDHVPSGVQDLVEDKLAAIDPAGRDLLRAASVAGTTFELDLVAAAADLAEMAALDAIDAALASRVVAEVATAPGATRPGTAAPGAAVGPEAAVPAAGPSGTGTSGHHGGHRYRFTHEIMQRRLYEQLSGPRRRLLHARLADAIEARRATQLDQYTPVLARHRLAAAGSGGDHQAVRWARAAARHAGQRRAVAEALRLHRQALEHVPADDPGLRAEVLADLGRAEVEAGDARGEQSLLDAAVLARRSARLDVAARATLGIADLARAAGSAIGPTATPARGDELRAEALALIDDVLHDLATTSDASPELAPSPTVFADLGEAQVEQQRLVHARLVARYVQLRQASTEASASTGSPIAAMAGWAQPVLCDHIAALAGPSHLDERLALADDLAAVSTAVDDPGHQAVALHHRAMVQATIAGGPPHAELRPDLVTGLRRRLADGDSPFRPATTRASGPVSDHPSTAAELLLIERDIAVAVTQGRFDDAWAAAEPVAARLGDVERSSGHEAARGVVPAPGIVAGRQLLVAWWLQGAGDGAGRLDLERERVLQGLGAVRDGGASDDDPAEQALLALVRGDRGRGRLAARAAAHDPSSLPGGDRWLHSVGLLALVAVELQDTGIAAAAYDLLAPHAGRACGVGYRSFVGAVTFHLGRLAAVVGDHADAERHLVAALQEHSDSRARPWIALTQHALADALEARSRAYDRNWVTVLRGESQSLAKALGLRPLGG